MPRRYAFIFAFLLTFLLGAGCATRGSSEPRPRDAPLTISIVNRNWADMRIYLARDGLRSLLGVVTTGSRSSFDAPLDYVTGGGSLRLIGDPIGSTVSFETEGFTADPGQTVEWTIRVQPAQSSLVIR